MPCFARILLFAPLALLASGVFADVASAQTAPAAQPTSAERCSGTFCDLYYRGQPADPAPSNAAPAPQGATPMTVPSGGILGFFKTKPASTEQSASTNPQPASQSFLHLNGGGLLNMGQPGQSTCSGGTICDFVGKSQPDTTASAVAVPQTSALRPGTVAPTARPAAPPPPTAEQIALANTLRKQREAQAAEQEAKTKCRLAGRNDPWHCYR